MLRFGAVEHHLVINKDRTVPGEQLGAHYSLNSLRVSVTFYRSMEANLKCEQTPVDILRLPVDLQLRCCKGVHHNNLSVTVLGLPYLHPAPLNDADNRLLKSVAFKKSELIRLLAVHILFSNLDIFIVHKEGANPLLDFSAEQSPFESDFHSVLRRLPLAAWQARSAKKLFKFRPVVVGNNEDPLARRPVAIHFDHVQLSFC